MLIFTGLGLGKKEIPYKAVEEIKDAEKTYVEFYTNQERNLSWLENKTGTQIQRLDRTEVEQEMKPVKSAAASKKTVFLTSGHPFSATTHFELKKEAMQKNIETKTISSGSIATAPSRAGLDIYKFGRTVTLTQHGMVKSNEQKINKNLETGLHTLILTDPGMPLPKSTQIIKNKFEEKSLIAIIDAGEQNKIIEAKNKKSVPNTEKPVSLILLGETTDKEESYLETVL